MKELTHLRTTEDPRTWRSSRLRFILKRTRDRRMRMLCYGILVNRRTARG